MTSPSHFAPHSREMTMREMRCVSDVKLQEELRKKAWESATFMMSKEEAGATGAGAAKK